MKSKLRIAINAQIPSRSGTGGVETVLRALASLGQLDDSSEEYVFIGHWADSDWLKPFMNERQKLITAPEPPRKPEPVVSRDPKPLSKWLRPLVSKAKYLFSPPAKPPIKIPVSDGFYERLDCEVIHFPYQDYVLCDLPSIYNPHDLQHLHYPQFFSAEEISRRHVIYPAACRNAQTVIAASQFVKQDIIDKYKIEESKVQVISWAPPEIIAENATEEASEDTQTLLKKHGLLDKSFVLYPAMTWEHKNHIRLLKAIAGLRDRENLTINLICTGHKNDFFPQIEKCLRQLKLENQVKFPGIIPYGELIRLYQNAQFVIIPTLFEAASGPLFEAWQQNVAAACSAVTSLPEQSSGAALLFNPFSIEEIADVLKRMSLDESLRTVLRARGAARLQEFSLERTLKSYRAVYRKAAGRPLNEEDRNLLREERGSERLA